ncbi:MAG: CPBP family intramembrane metalloprotease [Oscillospiraceae bacterium]|nr:CPBP family intramembrane metalloprotease [Oscillospiraceae bacterium]
MHKDNNDKKSAFWYIAYIIAPFFFHFIINLIASYYLSNPNANADKNTVNMYAKMFNIAVLFIVWIVGYVVKYDNKLKCIKGRCEFSSSKAIFWVCVRVFFYMLIGILLSSLLSSQKESQSELEFIAFINTVFLAPLGEELLFRLHTFGTTNALLAEGYTPFSKRAMLRIVWVFSTIGFSFAHIMEDVLTGQFTVMLFVKFLVYLFAGILYGFAYLKSNNLIYPLLMHFLNNLINSLLNEKLFYEWSPIIPVVCAILALIIAISIFLKKKTGEDVTGKDK